MKIKGFDRPDALLSGVESRTSSPVRIPRNEEYMANVYAHRKVHKQEKKRANYEDRQFYVVYDMNDNVIVAGTAEECAERLSIGLASFYCKASNQNSDKYNARHPSTAPRKYYVYTLKDKEE